MKRHYQFQVVVTKLTVKKTIQKQGVFRMTLINTTKELEPSSDLFQTEVLPIPAHQRIIQLSNLNPFKFLISNQNDPKDYIIKYQITSLQQGYVQTVHLPIQKTIREFNAKKKQMFLEKYQQKLSNLDYKIFISNYHHKQEQDYTKVLNIQKKQSKEVSEESLIDLQKEVQSLDSGQNAIRKSKASSLARSRPRPPQLMISKKELKAETAKAISLSPVPFSHAEGTSPAITKKDTFDLRSGVPMLKKISSLPLSQIQKVNQLLQTHYRSEQKKNKIAGLSYKLKIVILMAIIGIVFMLYDTISDRSVKRTVIIDQMQKASRVESKKGSRGGDGQRGGKKSKTKQKGHS